MKTLVTILALTAAVIASPALAKTPTNAAEHARAHVHSSGTYTFDGKVVSHDPDPFIRLEAIREAESGGANR